MSPRCPKIIEYGMDSLAASLNDKNVNVRVLRQAVTDDATAGSSCKGDEHDALEENKSQRTSDDNVVVSLVKLSGVGVKSRKRGANTKSKRKSTRGCPAHGGSPEKTNVGGEREGEKRDEISPQLLTAGFIATTGGNATRARCLRELKSVNSWI